LTVSDERVSDVPLEMVKALPDAVMAASDAAPVPG